MAGWLSLISFFLPPFRLEGRSVTGSKRFREKRKGKMFDIEFSVEFRKSCYKRRFKIYRRIQGRNIKIYGLENLEKITILSHVGDRRNRIRVLKPVLLCQGRGDGRWYRRDTRYRCTHPSTLLPPARFLHCSRYRNNNTWRRPLCSLYHRQWTLGRGCVSPPRHEVGGGNEKKETEEGGITGKKRKT